VGKESYHVIFTRRANDHLASIFEYIAKDDFIRAETYTQELVSEAYALSQTPLQGRPYRGDGNGLRLFSYGNYRIFYKVLESQNIVEIWAFWHGARKPPQF